MAAALSVSTSTRLGVAAVLLAAVVSGCSYPGSTPASTSVSHPRTVSVTELVFKRVGPQLSTSPSQVVLNGILWHLSDGRSVTPKRSDLVMSSTFGTNAVAVLRLPQASGNWLDVIFLSQVNGAWQTNGAVDGPALRPPSRARGLKLPFSRFVASTLTVGADSAWVFEEMSGSAVVSILKEPTYPTTFPGFTSSSISGETIYQETSGVSSTLVLVEPSTYIVLTGNVSPAALRRLAASLPPASAGLFPFSTL